MTELTDTEREQLHAPHLTPLNSEWKTCPICPSSYWPIVANIKAAVRAEGARDMRGKIEALADDFHDRSQSHAWPTPSSMAYRDAWQTASTALRALLADGGEPQ